MLASDWIPQHLIFISFVSKLHTYESLTANSKQHWRHLSEIPRKVLHLAMKIAFHVNLFAAIQSIFSS